MSADNEVVTRIGQEKYRTEVVAGGHTLVVDEPAEVGGGGDAPTPYDLLLGSIGACTAMTLRMYADRKGWPLEGVTVRLRQSRSHAKDCVDCATKHVGLNQIERELELEGPLTDEMRERLTQIADRCPVKQTLERGINVVAAQTV
ncbi:MAG TPA: OsmC family protein [Longimicrobium sp.]|nr:OsmC family protein [Longimicrobium sp.]